jgi:hypothetical protein
MRHNFNISDCVRLDGAWDYRIEAMFEVVRHPPVENGTLQYRVESVCEKHGRSARQDQLQRSDAESSSFRRGSLA